MQTCVFGKAVLRVYAGRLELQIEVFIRCPAGGTQPADLDMFTKYKLSIDTMRLMIIAFIADFCSTQAMRSSKMAAQAHALY
jgi:hypothetical protein